MGIILKLCDDEDSTHNSVDFDLCFRFLGMHSSEEASLIVIVLAMSMLVLTIILIVIMTISKMKEPKTVVRSTGQTPKLELPEGCHYHVFLSHVWSTGQAKTHAIVRKMQLLLPGLKVWLDVDNLHNLSKLESSVEDSAVFLLYYSKSYFQSKNCRREIYAALQLNKPMLLLYEDDKATIEDLKRECLECCSLTNDDKSPGPSVILGKLLGEDLSIETGSRSNPPILWINENEYSQASLNLIYDCILRHLPYYESNPKELEKGIAVPGEIKPMHLQSQTDVIVYEENRGCMEVANELQTTLGGSSSMMMIHQASEYLSSLQSSVDDDEDADVDVSTMDQHAAYLLFYLNKDTFTGDREQKSRLTTMLKQCLDNPRIEIILIHEKDECKGACDFGRFIEEAPKQLLLGDPYNLFEEIAIPLHFVEEYRNVAWQQILRKMGATSSIEGWTSLKPSKSFQSLRRFFGLSNKLRSTK